VYNFINDFRQAKEAQYFKSFNYTTLGHSKLYHGGHPAANDEPLSWTQEQPYFYPKGTVQKCGYFDACPTNQSVETIMDQVSGVCSVSSE
jgi:hypothetical protein